MNPDLKALLANDEELAALTAGFSEEERKEFEREMAGLFEDVQNMFAEFENRTIHRHLTADILAQTSDAELVLTVFDTLALNAPENLSEAEYLAALPPEHRAVYALYILAGEVDNGGFNQYYYNTEAEASAYLEEAFELIGAPDYARLVREACRCYRENRIAGRCDGTLEQFCTSYRNNPLSEYDQAFYALENSNPLHDLLVKFIRSREDAFVM
ncbi:MAG: DUF4375 domain-containing protein [Neisseria sp.]|nr:DUF4375 domain-containing protein [Neisseria sp.]